MKQIKSTSWDDVFMTESIIPPTWFVPTHYVVDNLIEHVHREYDLTLIQNIFVTVEVIIIPVIII